MRHRELDPLRPVRVAKQMGLIQVNWYQWVRGAHFRKEVKTALGRKWLRDIGGPNKGKRSYAATDFGLEAAREHESRKK
jgi:hypothetical protein